MPIPSQISRAAGPPSSARRVTVHRAAGWLALWTVSAAYIAPGSAQAVRSPSPANLTEARSLIARASFPEAEQHLRDAIAAHPDEPAPRFLLGEVLFREGRAADSLAAYTEAARLQVPGADDLVIVASDYVLLNDFADARRWLTLATEKAPGNAKAWYLLGRADYNLDRAAEAKDAFLTCLRLDPAHTRAQYNLGLVYERLREPELAIAAYRRAITLQEHAAHRDSQPYLDLGMLLLSQDHAADALPQLQTAVDLAASNPLAHQQLALCLEKLGRLQESAEHMAICERLAPQAESPPFFLGRIYHRLGREADAREQFARAGKLAGTKSAADVPNLEPPSP